MVLIDASQVLFLFSLCKCKRASYNHQMTNGQLNILSLSQIQIMPKDLLKHKNRNLYPGVSGLSYSCALQTCSGTLIYSIYIYVLYMFFNFFQFLF